VIGLVLAWALGGSGRLRRGDVIAALQVALEGGSQLKTPSPSSRTCCGWRSGVDLSGAEMAQGRSGIGDPYRRAGPREAERSRAETEPRRDGRNRPSSRRGVTTWRSSP
jgi:hypothetical protein